MLVVLPVGIYIVLAAVADTPQGETHHGMSDSPEWNIATIFLVAQTQSLYRLHIESAGRRISHPALGLIALLSLTIIVAAVANVQITLRTPSIRTLATMWTLFGLSTAAFAGFVTGARLLSVRKRGPHDE